jgi:hypothetical protein
LLKRSSSQLEPILDKYKDVLKKAGREVVERSRLSDETKEELKKPLVPYDKYISTANEFFDKILEKKD